MNTASRLESFDKEVADPDLLPDRCRILVSESTMRLVADHFEMELIGSLKVKGKDRKVTIYRVVRENTPTS